MFESLLRAGVMIEGEMGTKKEVQRVRLIEYCMENRKKYRITIFCPYHKLIYLDFFS